MPAGEKKKPAQTPKVTPWDRNKRDFFRGSLGVRFVKRDFTGMRRGSR